MFVVQDANTGEYFGKNYWVRYTDITKARVWKRKDMAKYNLNAATQTHLGNAKLVMVEVSIQPTGTVTPL